MYTYGKGAKKKGKGIEWLFTQMSKTNIAPDLETDLLEKIGLQVVQGYEQDVDSRTEWKRQTEEGLKIAKQVTEKKTFPWPGAANIKFPLIATASHQFAARALPQIVSGPEVVKAQVIGQDPTGEKEKKALRISQHMSWQLMEQMTEWEADMDQLLHGLPVVGTYFKKTFFDTMYQRNRSVAISPLEVVIDYNHKGGIDTCRRITQELWLYKNEVIERERSEMYLEGTNECMQNADEKPQELFLEQHCWHDLDEDGYEEPYIVTVHRETGKVARIVANFDETTMLILGTADKPQLIKIDAIQYFTAYIFIPSPDGSFYGIGFAHLLGPINETMSTVINQLLDAGTLQITGGGFISRGVRGVSGAMKFQLGEWKPVDVVGGSLRDAVFPLPVPQPSNVLFQLLGMLNEAGNKLASVSDTMSGEMPSQNTPATTVLAVIEQGLKVFSSIYKRVFRAFKSELKKLYRLNAIYLTDDQYFRVLDTQFQVSKDDYSEVDFDVIPVADPTISSEAQALARAQAMLQSIQINPDPAGRLEILRRYYEALRVPNIDKILNQQRIEQQMQNQPPSPEALKLQLETVNSQNDYNLKLLEMQKGFMELGLKLEELRSKIVNIDTQSIKNIADAEAVEMGSQLGQYQAALSGIAGAHDMELNRSKQDIERSKIEVMKSKASGGTSGEGAPAPQTNKSSAPPEAPAQDLSAAPSPPPEGTRPYATVEDAQNAPI
jgi:chaperonin GroES